MPTKEETDKSYLVFMKDTNNGKITRVAFPEDVQIGLARDPKELMLTGRLSINTVTYESDTVSPIVVDENCTLAYIRPKSSVTSGTIQVLLPKNPREGQLVFVKDDAGTSGVVNIVVSANDGVSTMDAETSKTISTSFGSVSFCWHRSAWHLYGQYNSRPLYGQFTDTTTQNATLAATTYYVSYNTVDFANGIRVDKNLSGNKTRIVVEEDGIYQLSISPQLYQAGSKQTASLWLVKNRENGGAAIANTCSDIDLGFGGSDSTLPMVPVLVDLRANDYVEWAWCSSGLGTSLLYTAPRAGPSRPADPSVILVIKRISPRS